MKGLILFGLAVLLLGGGSIVIARYVFTNRAARATPPNPTTTPAEKSPGGAPAAQSSGTTLEKTAPRLPGEGVAPVSPLTLRPGTRTVLPGVK